MQIINGLPVKKENSKVVIGFQIWLAAVSQVENLPDSVKKYMLEYYDQSGK